MANFERAVRLYCTLKNLMTFKEACEAEQQDNKMALLDVLKNNKSRVFEYKREYAVEN